LAEALRKGDWDLIRQEATSQVEQEAAIIDINAARQAILTYAPYVAAFAISGYFGVRNPTHELRVKRLVRRLTGLPVTCGCCSPTQMTE